MGGSSIYIVIPRVLILNQFTTDITLQLWPYWKCALLLRVLFMIENDKLISLRQGFGRGYFIVSFFQSSVYVHIIGLLRTKLLSKTLCR